LLTKQLGGDKINKALPPAGFLHNQKPTVAFDNVADGFFLAFAKMSRSMSGTKAE
jgi:hypothetical protein